MHWFHPLLWFASVFFGWCVVMTAITVISTVIARFKNVGSNEVPKEGGDNEDGEE